MVFSRSSPDRRSSNTWFFRALNETFRFTCCAYVFPVFSSRVSSAALLSTGFEVGEKYRREKVLPHGFGAFPGKVLASSSSVDEVVVGVFRPPAFVVQVGKDDIRKPDFVQQRSGQHLNLSGLQDDPHEPDGDAFPELGVRDAPLRQFPGRGFSRM